ncbi:WD repeat-containing protein 6 [Diorhabda sublineata]|uniref:WD repeat-containing protein 6 n=1 Tax=Diorhabda sublineata TaxID=1163346 RepID=UPI0024E1581E|nr:WD repeat-containing protein 6 [Diorhabda sublineata]
MDFKNKMLEFQSRFIKTNVTAIKVDNDVTLIGVGATLKVFCNKNNDLINRVNIDGTRGEHIFGIKLFTNKILLHGGQFLLLFQSNENYNNIEEIRRSTYKDWILESKLIDNETKIATVSMQNKLQIWNINLDLLETYECEEHCILYSAHICYQKFDELVILSGTVFNEVLVWKINKQKDYSRVLKRLKKHEGVIFSVNFNEQNGLICSTSDDRSAILWQVGKQDLNIELNEKVPNIFPVCHVYGHSSRIFRCLVINKYFVTAGEDSIINIWNLDGTLFRKVEANQNSPIWALDFDAKRQILVSGSGNGGVYAFPLNFDVKEQQICLPNNEKPKLVGILASNNLLFFSEKAVLYLYGTQGWNMMKCFEDLKSYVLLKVSRCRKLVALAGFNGQIYIFKEYNNSLNEISRYQSVDHSRITSVHWLTCNLVLICQDGGKLTLLCLKPPTMKLVSIFMLPKGSQRCSTTATIFQNDIIVGDRKGSLHRFEIGKLHPVQTIPKVHSHLGVTNLVNNEDILISLGRNGVIKTFFKNKFDLILVTTDKVPYSWLLDVIDELVIAFSGNNFVVWNYKTKRLVFEKICGGGHRSWDFYTSDIQSIFLYIKDKFIYKVQLDFDVYKSMDIIEPFHSNEINTMTVIKTNCNYIFISGGEDTTLRITTTNLLLNSFTNLVTLKSHKSSIRTIVGMKLDSPSNLERYLIFSAGGRAQIVCWTLTFSPDIEIKNLMCRENYSYYEKIDSEESENRIMDLCAIRVSNTVILFAACSDGYIKIFLIDDDVHKIELYKNIFYKLKCIFRLCCIKVLDTDVLVSLASDGKMAFWKFCDLFSDNDAKPFRIISLHQSGVNTVSNFQINGDTFLFLTAGDDCVVILTLLTFKFDNHALTVHLLDKYLSSGVHWAQITGSVILKKYFLTCSVDQRLVLYKWNVTRERIFCEAISKYNSSVADLKGLMCYGDEDFDVFIYGLGVEFLKLE